ncbi:MAG: ABC transporter permease subunit [Thermoplasmataceae archaeon]
MNRILSETIAFLKKPNAFGIAFILIIFLLLFAIVYPSPPKPATDVSYNMITYFDSNTSSFNSTMFIFDGQGFPEANINVNYCFNITEGNGQYQKFSGSKTTGSNGILTLSDQVNTTIPIANMSLENSKLSYSGGDFSSSSSQYQFSPAHRIIQQYFISCVYGQTNLEDRSMMITYLSSNLSPSPSISLYGQSVSLPYFGGANNAPSPTIIGNFSGFIYKDVPVSTFVFKNKFMSYEYTFSISNKSGNPNSPLTTATFQISTLTDYQTSSLGLVTGMSIFFMVLLLFFFSEEYFLKPMKNGTMESVLSRPIGRRELYLTRFIAISGGSIALLLIDYGITDIILRVLEGSFISTVASFGILIDLIYLIMITTSLTFLFSVLWGRKFSSKMVLFFFIMMAWFLTGFIMINSSFIQFNEPLSRPYIAGIQFVTILQYIDPFTQIYLINDVLTKSIQNPANSYGSLYLYGIYPPLIVAVSVAWILIPFFIGWKKMDKIDL